MAVELCFLARDSALIHISIEAGAQGDGGFAFAADADGEVAGAWEDPDVAFEVFEKLDVDAFLLGGHVVAEGAHGVGGLVFRADIAQRVARAGGDDQVVGFGDAVFGAQTPAAVARSMPSTRVFSMAAPACSARSSNMRFSSSRE